MIFWVREVAGWVMVGLGAFLFVVVLVLLARGQYIEAGTTSFVAFVVFRGGIHLLKVAVAYRACKEAAAQLQLAPAKPAAPPSRPLPGVRPPSFANATGNGNATRK